MHQKKRIILANDTYFFRDAFRRVLEKRPDLEIICEVKDPADLTSVVQKTDPDWIIISLPGNGKISEPVERLLIEYPNIHILAVSIDGSRIRVEWMEHKEEEAENLSLEDFIEIFESFESDPRKRSVLIGQS